MADDDKTDDRATDQATEQKADQTGKKDKADVNQLLEQMDAIKKAQAGQDRKNAELLQQLEQLRKEKETLEKEKMSEKEKADYERKKYEENIAQRETTIKERELTLMKTNILTELKLDPSYLNIISGNDEKVFRDNAAWLKSKFQEDTEKIEKDKRLNGQRIPENGKTSGSGKFTKERLESMTAAEYNSLTSEEKAEMDKAVAGITL